MTNYQYILFPGRHHLLTNFQHNYFQKILSAKQLTDINGKPFHFTTKKSIIWAVTSANHSNTRRNPIPANHREAAIERFGADLPAESFAYLIDDLGSTARFADHVIKSIEVQSRGQHLLAPSNTIVACSTPNVIDLYEKLGFRILPVELINRQTAAASHRRPWDIVLALAAAGKKWASNPIYLQETHPASRHILEKYRLGDMIVEVHSDPLVGDEGDITETRDYNIYRQAFDEGAERKYALAKDHIVPGRIVDIGCATGSIVKQMSDDDNLRESDLYGIEVARPLYEYCLQRKHNGEFNNENVFFYQRNIMRDRLFPNNSVNTTTTFSLTHEIESYGGRKSLLAFIKQVYDQTAPGGVFINVDVVAPDNPNDVILMKLNQQDGAPDDGRIFSADKQTDYTKYLDNLSTHGRFLRFARDFRHEEGEAINYRPVQIGHDNYFELSLADAAEFLTTKDYTDSWLSEMHERFCFWSFNDWKLALEKVGFSLLPESKAYRNEWIVKNRFKGKAQLYKQSPSLTELDFPVTNVLLVAKKP
jgi:SAM-dependent methyltransferase